MLTSLGWAIIMGVSAFGGSMFVTSAVRGLVRDAYGSGTAGSVNRGLAISIGVAVLIFLGVFMIELGQEAKCKQERDIAAAGHMNSSDYLFNHCF